MGLCRFMPNNLVTSADMIAVSSAAPGVVGGAAYAALGAATLNTQGTYTGDDTDTIVIEIDSVAAGKEIGQATYAWRKGSSSSWAATGQVTSGSLVALTDGVSIRFTAGDGDDFEPRDTWLIDLSRKWGRGSLISGGTSAYWLATGKTDEHITVDLGSAQAVGAALLAHHNLTSGAAINLMANDSDAWATPPLDVTIPWSALYLGYFPDASYRYWRWSFADASNPIDLSACELYLGPYVEMSRPFSYGLERRLTEHRVEISAGHGLMGVRRKGLSQGASWDFARLQQGDVDNLVGLADDCIHPTTGARRPVWVCLDSDYPSDLMLGMLGAELVRSQADAPGRQWAVPLSFTELARPA